MERSFEFLVSSFNYKGNSEGINARSPADYLPTRTPLTEV